MVGGGAGGLSLVARLARAYRRNSDVEVLLVDINPTHLWKPLLHEVATGSLDNNLDEISYAALARKYGFRFVLGEFKSIDADGKQIVVDVSYGNSGLPNSQRVIEYDQIVLAIGSQSNDFGTKGVTEHAILLDDSRRAEEFHQRFIGHLHRVNDSRRKDNAGLAVVIVGGGATGIELAADLHHVASQLEDFGFERFNEDKLDVTLLEAGPRVLGNLPERISQTVTGELESLGVSVNTGALVTEVTGSELKTRDGHVFPADLAVWAAGIRAPGQLAESGLETDRIGRVVTTACLNTVSHPELFVIGDCCHCKMPHSETDTDTNGSGEPEVVPPRAQSAHQMASTAYTNIRNQYAGKALKKFSYQDYGSLVSLSEYSTVGNLMGNLMKGSLFIEGWAARIVYRMLYRRHQTAIHGFFATLLIMVRDRLHRTTHSHLKLH